jgi:hypothetical protein
MNTNQTQTQTDNKKMEVNPLQLLVNASFLAYQRGAFSMKETSLISQAIDFFVETKQAVIPQVQNQPQNQSQNQSQQTESNNSLQINEQQPEKIIFPSQ